MGKLGMGFCLSYLFRGVVPDEIAMFYRCWDLPQR